MQQTLTSFQEGLQAKVNDWIKQILICQRL